MSTSRNNPTLTAFAVAIGLIGFLWLTSSGKEGLAIAFFGMQCIQAYCLFRVLTTSHTSSAVDRLTDLTELHKRGLITDDEFQSKRNALLGEL